MARQMAVAAALLLALMGAAAQARAGDAEDCKNYGSPIQADRDRAIAACHRLKGDDYLNLVVATIRHHFRYPDVFRRDGVTGVVVFRMTVARNGDVVGLDLAHSSGKSVVDLFAEQVIRRSSPLPPVPPRFSGSTVVLNVRLNVGTD